MNWKMTSHKKTMTSKNNIGCTNKQQEHHVTTLSGEKKKKPNLR